MYRFKCIDNCVLKLNSVNYVINCIRNNVKMNYAIIESRSNLFLKNLVKGCAGVKYNRKICNSPRTLQLCELLVPSASRLLHCIVLISCLQGRKVW